MMGKSRSWLGNQLPHSSLQDPLKDRRRIEHHQPGQFWICGAMILHQCNSQRRTVALLLIVMICAIVARFFTSLNYPWATSPWSLKEGEFEPANDAAAKAQYASFSPDVVKKWQERLDRILQLRDDSSSDTLRNKLLEEIKSFKTIRKLRDNSNKNLKHEYVADSRTSPVLSLKVQSDCWANGRWVVITTIAAKPTKTMDVLLEQNWCLVIVGDIGSPEDFPVPDDRRFVYLSVEDQKRLPYRIVPLTPMKSVTRKNLGYLVAMSQGAKVILDMDDDNEPIPIQGSDAYLPVETSYGEYDRPYMYKESSPELVADEMPVWNPYPFFNLTDSWPRGYPWEYLPFQNLTEHKMLSKQQCTPIIQQYLANWDPDLDAAYRLRFKLPMDYRDGSFRRIVMPRNVWSPYNAQATVHLPKAFWSLMLPLTVNERVSDIWRSYITQSLLHFVPDACLMFTSPAVNHTRNPHNYTLDFEKELRLYSEAASLIHLMRNLPMSVDNFQEAFLGIYQKLYETGVVEIEDYRYAQAWLSDLQRIGVYLPKIPGRDTWMRRTKLCINFNRGHVAMKAAPEIVSKYLPLFQDVTLFVENSTFPNAASVLGGHDLSNPLGPEKFKINEHWPPEVEVFACDSNLGFRSFRCIRRCLAYAGNKNAMYMNDDDYFNLARAEETLTKDVMWYAGIQHVNGSSPYNHTVVNSTTWWGRSHLLEGSQVLEKLPVEMKQAYLDHVNSTGQVEGNALADCMYVPQKYYKKLIEAIDRIEQLSPDLFHEVAVPLAVNMVVPGEHNRYTFDPDFPIWDSARFIPGNAKKLLPRAMHYHPLKMSSGDHRAAWRDIMALQYARFQVCNECQCCGSM